MKLGKRKHKINYGSEGVPPIRRIALFLEKKLSFLIYYLIIAIFIFFVVTSGWRRVAYINGNGIITKSLVRVRADGDLYVSSFHVEEGDTVDIGDTLCSYRGAHTKYYKRSGDGNRSLDRKLVTLQVSIDEKRSQRTELLQSRTDLKTRLEKSKNQVSLELKPDEKIVTLENAIEANIRRERRVVRDIENLKRSIKDIQALLRIEEDTTALAVGDSIIEWGSYQSHWYGEVHEYLCNEGEYVKDGEDILTMTLLNGVHIDAFFKMKYVEQIKEGTAVTLLLPNNKKVAATVSKVFRTSESLPSEFKKSYDISRPRLYAHITINDVVPPECLHGMAIRILVKRDLPWD